MKTDRINLRMLTIMAVFSLLVGIPVYGFVKSKLNHGIEKDGELFRVDLKSLGCFPFDDANSTLENVPARYRQLDGKRVALEGFPVPKNNAGPLTNNFQLVYNIQICCLGGPPQVQERVFANIAPGKSIAVAEVMTRLIGTLHVKVTKDSDAGVNKTVTLYTMDVEQAEAL